MKKRIASVLLSTMFVIGLLAGCNAAPASETGNNETVATGGTGEEREPIAVEDIKIGFVHISDPSDMGYTYNHDLGTKEMQRVLGIQDDQIINKFNVSEDASCETALRELVEAGCNIIFATSFGFEDYVLQVAEEYPDIVFAHATGYKASTSGLENMHNYFASIYEARYLAGIAAGLKTETNQLGYVAAFPFAEVISGYSAFYLGAKSVNPEVTMEIMYTNSWHDPTVESQVAKALIERGADVISQHSDSTAPATVAEENEVWQVGYNNDMIEAAPKASLVSARIDWSIYLIEAVEAVLNATEIPVDWCKGLEEGAVYLSPLNEDIVEGTTKAVIEEAAAAMYNGELKVFMGPLTGVSPDGEEINVAAGEHFPEQESASAPSWNYVLEGCTVVE